MSDVSTTKICGVTKPASGGKFMVYVPSVFPRSLFIAWALCTAGLALRSPESLTARLVERADGVGAAASVIFVAAVAVLLLDFLVNDVMPARFRFTTARNYRWLFVSSVATVYWLFGTIALLPGAAPDGAWVLIASYFGVGAWGVCFAFYTKLTKYRTETAVPDDPPNSQLA